MDLSHAGIDYGSQMAGTTVICYESQGCLCLEQSRKKEEADTWLSLRIRDLQPGLVFIDAPLSLPKVYSGKGDDYFFRKCDRETGAMSPMFLGGLTARAMRLRASFPDISFYEIYPARLARLLFSGSSAYKKDMPGLIEELTGVLPVPLCKEPVNWHQVDAVLAWLSGWRYRNANALLFGEEKEGLIVV